MPSYQQRTDEAKETYLFLERQLDLFGKLCMVSDLKIYASGINYTDTLLLKYTLDTV